MSYVKTIVLFSSCVFALAILFGASVTAFGQSTDETRPTPIAAFPVTGTLGSGTYYYRIPESLAPAGRANAGLNFTAPDGGASMSVTFSGPACCPGEAYIGETAGLSGRFRQGTSFDIQSRQNLLITIYISVGAGQTVPFSLNFNIGATSSGIIVTPPSPTPTPAPSPTPPAEFALCTDLLVSGFSLSVSGTTRTISGSVHNQSRAAFRSPAGQQWIEVHDISKLPRSSMMTGTLVQRIAFTEVPGRGFFRYSAVHSTPSSLPPVYRVRIVYSPANATDAITTNDDCTPANNTTLRRPEITL